MTRCQNKKTRQQYQTFVNKLSSPLCLQPGSQNSIIFSTSISSHPNDLLDNWSSLNIPHDKQENVCIILSNQSMEKELIGPFVDRCRDSIDLLLKHTWLDFSFSILLVYKLEHYSCFLSRKTKQIYKLECHYGLQPVCNPWTLTMWGLPRW